MKIEDILKKQGELYKNLPNNETIQKCNETIIQKLEDITSKEYLDKVFQKAILWCQTNLSKYLQGFKDKVDYNIFCYIIDNKMISADMRLDEKQEGLIRVSTEKLKWYLQREEYIKNEMQKIREAVKVDPESMFVFMIAEFILIKKPNFFDLETWVSKYFGRDHETAREIENINRGERGLMDWPEY